MRHDPKHDASSRVHGLVAWHADSLPQSCLRVQEPVAAAVIGLILGHLRGKLSAFESPAIGGITHHLVAFVGVLFLCKSLEQACYKMMTKAKQPNSSQKSIKSFFAKSSQKPSRPRPEPVGCFVP